jgi:hypothetical protein
MKKKLVAKKKVAASKTATLKGISGKLKRNADKWKAFGAEAARATRRIKKERAVMADDKVKVEALEYLTHDGKEYQEGDTFSVSNDLADSLVAQRKAKPYDATKAKPAAAKEKK